MGRLAREAHILHRQELLALRLLDRSLPEKGQEPGIDIQLDVFEKVGKWVAIKNKIADMEETDIDRFKQRINGTEVKAPQSRTRRESTERLDAIKARLPARGDGNLGGSGDDSVGEVAGSS